MPPKDIVYADDFAAQLDFVMAAETEALRLEAQAYGRRLAAVRRVRNGEQNASESGEEGRLYGKGGWFVEANSLLKSMYALDPELASALSLGGSTAAIMAVDPLGVVVPYARLAMLGLLGVKVLALGMHLVIVLFK